MRIWTFGEALDKVRYDLDLQDELFIQNDEYVGLFNDAIQTAASEIQKLGVEDEYFTTDAPVPIVLGTSLYSLPSDIYFNKIRALVYNNGSEIYPINRLRRRNKYLTKQEINLFESNADYQYDIVNDNITAGTKIELVPTARETHATAVNCQYIREPAYVPLVSAGSLAASRASKIDLPQFMTYIFAHIKWGLAKKIPHPRLADFKDDRDEEHGRMVSTLTEMVADDATEVEADLSHYGESS